MTNLTEIARHAADYIDEHGWTTGEMEDLGGAVCLHGAVRACTPQKGDAEIVRAVLRHKGYTEGWNDREATADDVTAALRSIEITDTDIAETFGPQWQEIVALVRRAAALTEDEAERLAAAWDAAGDAALVVALDAAQDAAWAAAQDNALIDAQDAAQDAAQNAAQNATQNAAWDTAAALSVRDLIGKHGFTQGHYDTLTHAWRTVIGPIHPDDAPLTEGQDQ